MLFQLACRQAGSAASIGEAYVAPESLNLRRELTAKASTGHVLKHGERVEIIDVRRRFVKVRSAHGQEGWVDSAQLLNPEQMEQIKREAKQALELPSEGSATVYEPLNIHIAPDRQSPAFARIQEGTYVAVLAYRLVPKSTAVPAAPALLRERPQPLSRKQRKDKSRRDPRLPAPPPPPKAPANWEELSAERIDGYESTADAKARRETEALERKAEEARKPVMLENWTLIRTKDKQSGWVLSRNLIMGIPDEVAQYAEGKRITSYFDLGQVSDDEKGPKHNWLWTTLSKQQPFDFDGWRVFLWNRRHHRYETSYRQRVLEGYFPVRVDPPDPDVFGRTFHLVTRDDDGQLRTRTYIFDGMRLHLTGTELYRQQALETQNQPTGLDLNKLQSKLPRGTWLQQRWATLKQLIFGTP